MEKLKLEVGGKYLDRLGNIWQVFSCTPTGGRHIVEPYHLSKEARIRYDDLVRKGFTWSVNVDGQRFNTHVKDDHDLVEEYVPEEEERQEEGFKKFDNGKPPLSLLAEFQGPLGDIATIIKMGADKYGQDNWKQCKEPQRYKDAFMRHAMSYCSGDTFDDESGVSHAAHCVVNLLFLEYLRKQNDGESE